MSSVLEQHNADQFRLSLIIITVTTLVVLVIDCRNCVIITATTTVAAAIPDPVSLSKYVIRTNFTSTPICVSLATTSVEFWWSN